LDSQKNSPVFVAVVDDESDIAYLFKDALDNIPGVKAFAFSDPNLALEHFRYNQKKYKCIVSDYRMPSMNGIELLEKVRELDSTVTRVLISAFDVRDEVFNRCQCVDLFLQKPIRINELVEKVQKYLFPIK
jgi:response regulator RpfG family c-di-GMP phosphodiesterase